MLYCTHVIGKRAPSQRWVIKNEPAIGEEKFQMHKIENATAMGFVRIAEAYPNEYILAKIVEIDHSKGRETGIPLYLSESWGELADKARNDGLNTETIILQGDNLKPVLGGLL